MKFENQPLDPVSKAIHERALACAKKFLTAEYETLCAIMEVDKRRVYEKFGLEALTPYCVKILGLSEPVAEAFVRVARKSEKVPELKEAVEMRRITLLKAKTIASIVNQKNCEEWINKAQSMTKEKLEEEIRIGSGKKAFKLPLILTKEQWILLKRARELVSVKLGKSASIEETLVVLGEYYLEKFDPVQKADRNPTYSHNDRSQERSPTSSLKIPSRIRHEVNRRDRGKCQALRPDGTKCENSTWVHHHHIVPREKGGPDTVENLITLCTSHHSQWHATT
jgi:hypothetical protein